MPRYLNQRKFISFIILVLLLIAVSGFVKYGLALTYSEIILKPNRHRVATPTFAEYYAGAVIVSTFFVFLSSALKFAKDWFVNEKLRKSLEKEKLKAEIAFLRSQINPHFLFNSLNNIYSLAYQKSEKTPEAILKLSEIMRYMLDESTGNSVSLNQEIRYLENYIDLQRLRIKDANIEFKVIGKEYGDRQIAPLILIAIIENAFKHGNPSDSAHPTTIEIELLPDRLFFIASNPKTMYNKEEASGIGVQNVKRRLELLYPGKYNLEIDESRLIYTCKLSLVL